MERALFIRYETAEKIAYRWIVDSRARNNTRKYFIDQIKQRGEIKGYAIRIMDHGEYGWITEDQVEYYQEQLASM